MRRVRNRWSGHPATRATVTALVSVLVILAAIGSTTAVAAAQIVCVDSPFLGLFDEDADGVLSLDEVLAVSDANAQVAAVAEEMQARGITGFRYIDCDPEAVPTGAPEQDDAPEPTQAPEPTSGPDVTPTDAPTEAPDPTATTQTTRTDAVEEEGPLVVTTLPGVGHGRQAPHPAAIIAGAGAGAGAFALLLAALAVHRTGAGTR